MKRVLLLFLSFVLFAALALNAAAPAALAQNGDEIRASKKIISVVYDDSGSMGGERWSYTNYAMQALIALLNEQDDLYITFMSDPMNSHPFDTSDLAGSIKHIHDWNSCSGTPGETLDTAYDLLKSIKETDATAQYWLVIMTDGAIAMSTTIQNKLDSYKHNKMHNGTELNVVYLGMGAAVKAHGDQANHLYTFDANSDDDIIETMRDVANLVSGRLVPDGSTQIDDTTISVTSKLPLYSISILSQDSNASVTGAETDEEKLNVARNLALDATDLPLGEHLDKLYGNAAVINNKDSSGKLRVIPAGTYTISFSSNIDINNMMIQVEPAIALKAEISRNGVVIDDTSKLAKGDVVDVRIIPVVPGTDDVIASSDLPKQISWDIEYEVDGTVVDSGSGMELKGVTLESGSNIVRGIISIPGYAPFVSEVYFNIAEIVHHFAIQVVQPSGLSYDRKDLKKLQLDDTNTIKFRITDDGKVLTKQEQQSFGVTLLIDDVSVTPVQDKNIVYTAGKTKAKCSLIQNDDGSYSLIPGCPALAPIIAIQAGDYTVTVKVSLDDSVREKGVFTIVPQKEDAKDIPKIIGIILAILYLLYLLFIKKKFSGQTVHYEVWRIQENGKGLQQMGLSTSQSLGFFSGHFLSPRAARVKSKRGGLILVAGGDGSVIVTEKSLAKGVAKYGKSTRNPHDYLGAIEAGLIKTVKPDGKRSASEQELTNQPLYLKTSDRTDDLIKVWLTND